METQTIMGLDATIVVLMALAGAGCLFGAVMRCIARREEQQDGESVGIWPNWFW